MIDELKSIDDCAYTVTLKKVFKQEEGLIKIWVKNDPRDQSEESEVFGFISPSCKDLNLLDEKLVKIVGKRVYDSISVTWNAASQPE